jgi:hypothetical protein
LILAFIQLFFNESGHLTALYALSRPTIIFPEVLKRDVTEELAGELNLCRSQLTFGISPDSIHPVFGNMEYQRD